MAGQRIKVTLTLPADVVRAYRVHAARKGIHDNAVVEQALRKQLGIGFLESLPVQSGAAHLSDDEADQIAVQAVRAVRAERS
jgi:hypothetical protein